MRSLLMLAVASLLAFPALAGSASHCGQRAAPEPVPGRAGAWRLHLRTGERIVRVPAPRPTARRGGPVYVVEGLDLSFNTDGNVSTIVDTLFVPIGSTVSFQMITGIHTVTNGLHSGDPNAGQQFDYLLAEPGTLEGVPAQWDTTLMTPAVIDYFCLIHESPDYRQSMAGTIVVQDPNSVDASVASRVGFSREPAPNPSRGSVGFAITLPVESNTELSVHDVSGRRVATLHRGLLRAGEHAWQWNGRTDSGVRAAAGRYVVRLRAGATVVSRAVSLVR